MILQKMPHYVDSILTQEDASAECPVGGPLPPVL